MPAEPVHGGETDLVARVVADEDGGAAAKRLFLHELADAHALVFPCGTHLDDVLAALNAELASDDGKHGPGQPVRVGREARCAPVVEGEGQALVLQQQAGLAVHRVRQPQPHALEAPGRHGVACDRAAGAASLEAVLARDRQPGMRKQPVDLGDGSATHQRDRSASVAIQPLERAAEVFADMHTGRRVGEIDERAVEIEEVGPLALRRRRPTPGQSPPLASAARGRAG